MTVAKSLNPLESNDVVAIELSPHAAISTNPLIFTDIYQSQINIAVWQRQSTPELSAAVNQFVQHNPTFKQAIIVSPKDTQGALVEVLGTQSDCLISADIAQLVDMFCCLFELKRVGLRLTTLDKAMCPRFHVDKVPCRLVTTYQGEATEWLPHDLVNRDKLGPGSKGQSDSQSRLYQNQSDIQQLNCADVALLKGEIWQGNQGAGLVHRSPVPLAGENRLLLTLDFSD